MSIDEVSEFESYLEKHEFLEGLLMEKISRIPHASEEIPDDYAHPAITEVERSFLIVTESERGFQMEGSVFGSAPDLVDHAFRWSDVGMNATATVIKVCADISNLSDEVGAIPVEGIEGEAVADRLQTIRRNVEILCRGDDSDKCLVNYVLSHKEEFCSDC